MIKFWTKAGLSVYLLTILLTSPAMAENATQAGSHSFKVKYLQFLHSKTQSFQERRLISLKHYIRKNAITPAQMEYLIPSEN